MEEAGPGAEEVGQAGASNGPCAQLEPPGGSGLEGLPDAMLGLIFSRLDRSSQLSAMQASKAIATSPSVLAQINKLTIRVGGEPAAQLLCFPSKASLRELVATGFADVRSTIQAWASKPRCRQMLRGLHSLFLKVRQHLDVRRPILHERTLAHAKRGVAHFTLLFPAGLAGK